MFGNVFMTVGNLTNNPSLTVFTLAYDTLNNAKCLVALTGT